MNNAVLQYTISVNFNKCKPLKRGELCSLKLEKFIIRTAFFCKVISEDISLIDKCCPRLSHHRLKKDKL